MTFKMKYFLYNINFFLFYIDALNLAVRKGNLKIVKLLYDHPKFVFSQCIFSAVLSSNLEMIKFVLSDQRTNVSDFTFTPLEIAIEMGSFVIIELLLSHPTIDLHVFNLLLFNRVLILFFFNEITYFLSFI